MVTLPGRFIRGIVFFMPLCVGALVFASTSAFAAATRTFEAESAKPTGGADTVMDRTASGRRLVSLSNPGQGMEFTRLPAASKLAIRYASVTNGTISVAVNDQPARKVNVHSSGALTNSFLNAIVEIAIPSRATLTISLATNDVALPPLPVASGPYSADWKAMSRVPLSNRGGRAIF